MTSSRRPTQNKLNGTCVDLLSHTALFGLFFCLAGFCLVIMVSYLLYGLGDCGGEGCFLEFLFIFFLKTKNSHKI